MLDSIKQLMFSVTGLIVTILHVIFVLGAYHFATEAIAAWEGDASYTAPVSKKK